jgi:hypothetical protein
MPRFKYPVHHAFLHHTLLCSFPSPRVSCFEYPVYGAFVLLLSLTLAAFVDCCTECEKWNRLVYLKATCMWNVSGVDTRVTRRISSRHLPARASRSVMAAIDSPCTQVLTESLAPEVNVFKVVCSNQYTPVLGFKDLIRRLWLVFALTRTLQDIDHVRNS